MNLEQFRNQTAHLPGTMDIFLGERLTGFSYGLVNSATVKEIPFLEDESEIADENSPRETVLILEEE